MSGKYRKATDNQQVLREVIYLPDEAKA